MGTHSPHWPGAIVRESIAKLDRPGELREMIAVLSLAVCSCDFEFPRKSVEGSAADLSAQNATSTSDQSIIIAPPTAFRKGPLFPLSPIDKEFIFNDQFVEHLIHPIGVALERPPYNISANKAMCIHLTWENKSRSLWLCSIFSNRISQKSSNEYFPY